MSNLEPRYGYGASQQSWERKDTLRAICLQIMEGGEKLSDAQFIQRLTQRAIDDPATLDALVEYASINFLRDYRKKEAEKTEQEKRAREKEARRQEAKKHAAEAAAAGLPQPELETETPEPAPKSGAKPDPEQTKREIETAKGLILLNLQMPNGKLLRYCTGDEVVSFGQQYIKLGKRCGDKLVGQVLSDAEAHRLMSE
jgi:hypothetical protein